ncbi:ABC transporter substrate-binding protein (plasmid) [Bartonella sp. HY329]|nr:MULTISPECIES: ABC transporter substrate-binding protein [unclassified Bartonella]UXM96663.1 ABC transporter substrate-binding protein [Bartonella sp. HY329]UXN10986.1 ABC transporter substrate-binding protein [Bartonella sp. HY328]
MTGLTLSSGSPLQAQTPPNALIMAWNIDAISSFDPAQTVEVVTAEILQNTCDALVQFDPKDPTNVLPALAQSWDISDDAKTLTFHLRDNLKFDDGRVATAADYAWSIQRVVKLGLGNAATLTEYGFTKDNIDELVSAPDDHTLVIKLVDPYPIDLILSAIGANRVTYLLDRQTLEKNAMDGDMGNKYLTTHTACVGPYKLMRWNPSEVVLLQASDHYWGKAPKLKQVFIKHVSESGTQRLLLEKGDIDVARDLSAEDILDLEKKGNVNIERTLRPQMVYIMINNKNPILANEKVRLAFRYLIDYDTLGKTILNGIAIPRASYLPLQTFGALDESEGEPFKLDLEKAKQLITEAGYPNGFDANFLIGSLPYMTPVAQSIQDNAKKIGINLKIERMAQAQLLSRTRGGEFDTAIMGWQSSAPDGHANSSRHVFNPDATYTQKQNMYVSWRVGYYDEEANKMVNKALFETDPKKRGEDYHEIQRYMFEHGPMAYLFQTYYLAGVNKRLKNWTWTGYQVYYDMAEK